MYDLHLLFPFGLAGTAAAATSFIRLPVLIYSTLHTLRILPFRLLLHILISRDIIFRSTQIVTPHSSFRFAEIKVAF